MDDEEELLEIYSYWIKRRGATVLTAANGAAALKVLETETVHVLVTDIRMPILDGVSLVRTLMAEGRTIPSIIFISGFADIDSREAYALGVEAMLVKPTRQDQLIEAITKAVKDRRELWAEPHPQTPQQIIDVDFPSLAEATQSGAFALGRGGCSLRSLALFAEGVADLRVHFSEDQRSLRGQGLVRWLHQAEQKMGLEFLYLTPDSRAWVADEIEARRPASYIPI